jgi:hypothetical protein
MRRRKAEVGAPFGAPLPSLSRGRNEEAGEPGAFQTIRVAERWLCFTMRDISENQIMLFKIIAFIAAAVPLILFVRAVFFQRTTKLGEGVKEFKKQFDLAIWIFLGLIGCIVVFAAGKLLWTWWITL